MENKPVLERRQIIGTTIRETYAYSDEAKEIFLAHYKEMRKRGFKNDRDTDIKKGDVLYVIYDKEALKKNIVVKEQTKWGQR